LVGAFTSLGSTTQTTIAGQLAFQNALTGAEAAGAKLGITITNLGATTNSTNPAVQALAAQINAAIQAMNAANPAGEQMVGTLNNISSAANNAASSMRSLADEVSAAMDTMGQGGQGGGGSMQALPGSQVTQGEPSAAGGPMGTQTGIIPIPPDPSPGTDYFDYLTGTWKPIPSGYKSINSETAAQGVPQAGYTAQTATALGAVATAATSAATPLGAVATAATSAATATSGLATASAGATTTLTGVAAANDTMRGLVMNAQNLNAGLGAAVDGTDQFGNQIYSLTQVVGNQVIASHGAADQLINVAGAAGAAASALSGGTGNVTDATGAAASSAQMLATSLNTSIKATDLYAADTTTLSTAQTSYYNALATSINAQNAYTNAVNSGTSSAAQLNQLFQAMVAAAQAAQPGTASGGPTNQTTTTGGGPTTPMPTSPPAGTSQMDAATGGWVWNGSTWVWTANQHTLGGQISNSGNLPAQLPNSFQLGLPSSVTNYNPGLTTPTSPATPGVTLQVNVNAGTVVGQNAGVQLAQMVAPNIVAMLRQAGVKLG
jgi:hypothetical protein